MNCFVNCNYLNNKFCLETLNIHKGCVLKVVFCVIVICIYTKLEIYISTRDVKFEDSKLPHNFT